MDSKLIKNSNLINLNFQNLPLEILILIFERLNIENLLKCRLLSKQFRIIVNKILIKELIISKNDLKREKFYFTDKSTNYRIVSRSLSENKLINILNTSIINLINLTSLKIEFQFYDYKILNRFINLINLDIFISDVNIENLNRIDDNELCLDKLETLYLMTKLRDCKLNTPKLKYLNSQYFDRIHLLNSNSIIHLETCYFYKKIFKLSNLEILKVDKIEYIEPNILKNLKNLKEIHFLGKTYLGCALDTIIGTIRYLLKIKEKEKLNLNIYFKEEFVRDISQLDTFETKYRVIEKCGTKILSERKRVQERNKKNNFN